MENSILKKLLNYIHDSKDLFELTNEGYTFKQINDGIIIAKEKGLIKTHYRKIVITDLGISLIASQKKFEKIKPLDKIKKKQIPLDEIYIPTRI